jgi:hypothetical protein
MSNRTLALAGLLAVAGCDSNNASPNPGPQGPANASPNAKVFFPAPAASGVDVADLVEVSLPDLIPALPGGYLRGWHMETYNCCKRYTCTDGAAQCDLDLRICAADDDTAAIESSTALTIPTSSIPVDLSQLGFTGDTIYAKTVFCTERPRLQSQVDGWYPTPVDVTRTVDTAKGLASETDAFAELQAYYATARYFEHLRDVLGDPTFCLAETSMQCDANGDAVLAGDLPARAFHITANMLFPAVDMTSLATQIVIQRRGTTAANPVVIDDYDRNGNAYFLPALESSPIEIPPGLEALSDYYYRPYDSTVYMQGERDFAYDGDVVFHEFTHALVHTFVPGLASMGHDAWGSHAEPGAMNEGWADYFSASFTGDAVTGAYAGGESGIRSLDGDAACPSAIIGEVHQDSLPWSNALWDLRTSVQSGLGADGVKALDNLLLMTVSQADDDETMARQADRVLAALATDDALASYHGDAEAIFSLRGVLACERVRSLSTVSGAVVTPTPVAELDQPAAADVGLQNMAPAVVQLSVQIPAGSPGFMLAWQQSGGGFMATGSLAPLSVLVHEGGRVVWSYTAGSAAPLDLAASPIPFDPTTSKATLGTPDTAGTAAAAFSVTLTPQCSVRTFFISLVATGAGGSLADIGVTVAPDAGGC